MFNQYYIFHKICIQQNHIQFIDKYSFGKNLNKKRFINRHSICKPSYAGVVTVLQND